MDDEQPPAGGAEELLDAVRWRIRLTEAGMDTTPEFEAWLAFDARHRRAWNRLTSSWELLGEHATSPELLAWRRDALDRSTAVARRRWGAGGGWFRKHARALAVAAAAAAVSSFIALGVVWQLRTAPEYQTSAGERRTLSLPDGSQMSLDASSAVRVRYTARERSLHLLRGQARFSVARERARPFAVTAAGRRIVATGTVFNVDLLRDELFVTLIEGKVVVNAEPAGDGAPQPAIELRPGQQLVAGGTQASVRAANLEQISAWERGLLVFENETLVRVLARITRYATHDVRLVDERSQELRISGVFEAGDLDGFVSTIASYLPLRAVTTNTGDIELVLREASAATP